jgi:hypothetical protein
MKEDLASSACLYVACCSGSGKERTLTHLNNISFVKRLNLHPDEMHTGSLLPGQWIFSKRGKKPRKMRQSEASWKIFADMGTGRRGT